MSYDTDKLIISDNYEYWLGNEEETLDFIDGLWNDLEPRLVRYWAYLKKVKRNGQGQLLSRRLEPIGENSKARNYNRLEDMFKKSELLLYGFIKRLE